MGYIEIPAIEVTLPVYHGTEGSVLQIAAGHLDWTSLPVGGEGTHCVLSGHRGLPRAKLFTDLDQLTQGDVFMLRVLDEVLTYEVDQILIVEPQETQALEIWNDAACETSRPAQITVQLLQNGVLYDTVTLCPANNWRYTWEDLPAENEWTMAEQVVPGYTALVAQKGITFTVTNIAVTSPTSLDTPSLPVLPQTGQLWWPVPVLAAIGLLLLVLGLMRRKGEAS